MKNKKRITRLIATILSFIIFSVSIPSSIYATEKDITEIMAVSENSVDNQVTEDIQMDLPETGTEVQSGNIEVVGQDSFGDLLADKIEEKTAENQDTEGYSIVSVDVEGSAATVEYSTLEDAMVIVAIYKEDQKTLVATGHMSVTQDEDKVTVNIETETMPEYFYVKVYLINIETYGPLCATYESSKYTKEMQELFALTTDQFEDSKVYNFDDDSTNNFGVYNEDVVVDKYGSITDQTVYKNNSVYTFENASEQVLGLQSGDIYAWESKDGLFIVKVADISIQGTTVIVTAAETDMEEVFQYLKLDMQAMTDEATLDTSSVDESLIYLGVVEDVEDNTSLESESENQDISSETAISGDLVGNEASLKYQFKKNDYFDGSFNVKINPSLKYYISFSLSYFEIEMDYKVYLSGSLKGEKFIPVIGLGSPSYNFGDSLVLKLDAGIGFEFKGKTSLDVTFSGKTGFSISTDTGIREITKNPKVNMQLKAEVSVHIGLVMNGVIQVVSSDVINAKVEDRVGIEIKGALVVFSTDRNPKQHSCKECIDGDITFKAEKKVNANITKKWKWSDAVNISVKLLDWYYSLDNLKGGSGACPNIRYDCVVAIKDENGNLLDGANVQFKQKKGEDYPKCYVTSKGEVSEYLKSDTYTVEVSKNGYVSTQKKLIVKDQPRSIQIQLKAQPQSQEKKFVSTRCSDSAFAAITEDGVMYYSGVCGYETDDKLNLSMENVKDVQLRDLGGIALKKDGSVWTWGSNNYGQIGNGYATDKSVLEPYHVLDDVKSIYAGYDCYAVIKNNGELWTWGSNVFGQIGQGIEYNSDTGENKWEKPACVLQNVEKVSMGKDLFDYETAAITQGGDCYVWGYENGAYLKKIMQNVKDVVWGKGYDSNYYIFLKNDGTVWSYGDNKYGQLGLGTTINQENPQKINLSNVDTIYVVNKYSLAITKGGNLYIWGGYLADKEFDYDDFKYYDVNGNLIEGFSDCRKPCLVTTDAKKIAGGFGTIDILKKNGTLWSWGYVYDQGLGDLCNSEQYWENYTTIQQIKTGVSDFNYADPVYTGDISIPNWSAILEDGSVVIWGDLPYDGTNWSDCSNIEWTNNYHKVFINQVSNHLQIEKSSEENEYGLPVDWMASDCSDVSAGDEVQKNYEGLNVEELYNFYVLKEEEGIGDIFSTDNLLYLTQGKSDKEGKLSVSYISNVSYENAKMLLVGSQENNEYVKSDDGSGENKDSSESKEDTSSTLPSGSGTPDSPKSDTSGETKPIMCTVVYKDGDGLRAKTIKTVEVPKGETIASTGIEEPVIVKQGYEFKGWKYVGSKWDFNKDKVNWNMTLTPILEYIYSKGESFDDGLYIYRITSVGKNPTVKVIGRCLDEYSDEGLYADEGYISIPNTVTMNGVTYKITAIGKNAFMYQDDIEKVVMGKNITAIEKNAFLGCTNIEKLVIGTNVKKIDSAAFSGCISLKKVTIPSKVKTIGKNAFKGCKKLSTLKIGKKVTSIGTQAFSGCTSLKKVTIPRGVKSIGKKAFYRCSNLKRVTIKANKLNKLGTASFKNIKKGAVIKIMKKYKTDMKLRCDDTTNIIGVNVF